MSKVFQCHVNLFNQTWFGFQIALWMVGSLFANTIKNYIYSFDFHDVTPLFYWSHWDLPKNTRSSNWNMFQHFKLHSKLEKINKQQTIWNFVQLMKLDFFFSNIFFFLKFSKFFKHVHKTIWNLWKCLKSQQSRFNEMNKMKCDLAMVQILN